MFISFNDLVLIRIVIITPTPLSPSDCLPACLSVSPSLFLSSMIGGAGSKPWGILALDSSGLSVSLKIMSGVGGTNTNTNSTYNKMLGIQSRSWILPVRVSRVWTVPSSGESVCCTNYFYFYFYFYFSNMFEL